MTRQEKIDHLKALPEDALRVQVLAPLLIKLGFHDPVVHHHAGEKGKDIICKDPDEKLGKTRYIALVVKSGDLTGAASGSNSYFTLLNQIKQAINEPCKDVYEGREISIDQIIVVVSGRILPTALDSVFGTLRAERIDRLIRDTIDGERLVTLMDDKLPAYWSELENPTEALLNQRNILLNNLAKLLTVLVPEPIKREKALAQLGTQEFEVSLFPFHEMARYMVDFGYGRITIDKLDDGFTEPFLNTDYQDIRQQISHFRKRVQHILYEISDGVEPLVGMLETAEAKELAKLSKSVDRHVSRGSQLSFDVSDVSLAEELIQAIDQYQARRVKLESAQCRDLYQQIMRDLRAKLCPALTAFYSQWGKEARDRWIGYQVSYQLTNTFGSSKSYAFQAEPRLLRDDGMSKDYEMSRSYYEPADTFHVEIPPRSFGWWDEPKLSLEKKVEDCLKRFEQAFAEAFFEKIGDPASLGDSVKPS